MLRGLRKRPRALAECERVVVFVHGFMAAGPVFDPMREHVERETELPTIDFTYGPHVGFDEIVDRFASHVEGALPRGARVSLVGHSLGGIVARCWLQERGGSERTDRLITLATPHGGTDAARGWPGSIAAALRPGSPVLARLERGRKKLRIPHVAVVAGADRMCTPPSSAAKLEDADVHWLDDVGHNEMLYDPRVLHIVSEALKR